MHLVSRTGDALAPGFIIAMPQLGDPNFHRSVVLLLKSNDSGAFGVVINRPGPISVAALCEGEEIPYSGSSDEWVMIGGPVEQRSHLLVLHGMPPLYADEQEMELQVAPGLRLVVAREGLARLASHPTGRWRSYLGYAGWGPGQLESELEEGAWVPAPADVDLLFDQAPASVWEKALRSAGIDPITLVPGGEPS